MANVDRKWSHKHPALCLQIISNSRQTLKYSDKTNKSKHINLREIAFKMIQLLLNMNIVVTTITLYYIKSHKVGGLSHANCCHDDEFFSYNISYLCLCLPEFDANTFGATWKDFSHNSQLVAIIEDMKDFAQHEKHEKREEEKSFIQLHHRWIHKESPRYMIHLSNARKRWKIHSRRSKKYKSIKWFFKECWQIWRLFLPLPKDISFCYCYYWIYFIQVSPQCDHKYDLIFIVILFLSLYII